MNPYSSPHPSRKNQARVAALPLMNRDNKGIYAWSRGKQKYRVMLAKKPKLTTIGYYYTFEDAVRALLAAHLKRFGELPECNYRDPESGKLIYRGAK